MKITSNAHKLSAEFYLYDWNPELSFFEFKQMSDQSYRDSPFLDARIRSVGIKPLRYHQQTLEQFFCNQPPRLAPIIFHTGYCGSTLLSRALSASQNILPLREPKPLWKLAASYSVLEQPTRLLNREQWNVVARILLRSYARSFGEHQVALIKATSTSSNLIVPLIENTLLDRAMLLYQPLRSHLATNLRAEAPRNSLRTWAVHRMREWIKIPGVPKLYVSELSAGKLAVVSWLGSMYLMLEAMDQYPEHCRLYNFDTFLEDSENCMLEISEWMGFASEQESLLAALPEITSRNSKRPGESFLVSARQQKHAKALKHKTSQVKEAMDWAGYLTTKIAAFSKCREYVGD